MAGPDYATAAGNCLPIGKFSAEFIDFLVALGLNLSKLHIIGLSLGAQIAGLTGKHVKSGRIHRITGKNFLSYIMFPYILFFLSEVTLKNNANTHLFL